MPSAGVRQETDSVLKPRASGLFVLTPFCCPLPACARGSGRFSLPGHTFGRAQQAATYAGGDSRPCWVIRDPRGSAWIPKSRRPRRSIRSKRSGVVRWKRGKTAGSAEVRLILATLPQEEDPPTRRFMRRLRELTQLSDAKKRRVLKVIDDLIRADS